MIAPVMEALIAPAIFRFRPSQNICEGRSSPLFLKAKKNSFLMSVQLGFLEPLEWTTESQNDFSISRLGGLPVLEFIVPELT